MHPENFANAINGKLLPETCVLLSLKAGRSVDTLLQALAKTWTASSVAVPVFIELKDGSLLCAAFVDIDSGYTVPVLTLHETQWQIKEPSPTAGVSATAHR